MLVTKQSATVSFGFGREIRDGEGCNMLSLEGGKGSYILLEGLLECGYGMFLSVDQRSKSQISCW